MDRLKRFATGDLTAIYQQLTPEEVEAERQQFTFQVNGETHIAYDERMLSKRLLPSEQRLEEDFLNARAQMWGTSLQNAEQISWKTWNDIRLTCKTIHQGKAISALKQLRSSSGGTSARDIADQIIYEALQEAGHTYVEVSALESELAKEVFVIGRVATPVHHNMPFQLPERIPKWAWYDGLCTVVPSWWKIKELPAVGSQVVEPRYPNHLQRIMSAPPYSVIDRASRSSRNWVQDSKIDPFPFYEDGRTAGIRLTYGEPDTVDDNLQAVAQQALEQVNNLDDRTADVWRVILWKAAESGISNSNVFAKIRIDTREVAVHLGYKKHHKGGMKPEHLYEVDTALRHLERMRIYLSPDAKGTLELEDSQGKGKRKSKKIIRPHGDRVISVMSSWDERNLFDKPCNMVWVLALGDWVRFFPSSYAPYFKALVALPLRQKWAKRIGTELLLNYRQDTKRGEKVKRLKWRTILDRAGLTKEVEELRRSPNRSRVTKYAEAAMDVLQEIG